ncbi:hypothetical protein [Microbacterium soli]|uniref:Uncharacterized protein n=1 Tax=Microbacterium soli TaxID=446075 RepID=A0ABP7N1Y6_9MICO
MDSSRTTTRAGTLRGVLLLLTGVALALWVVLGRFLFGIGGDLTLPYLALGVPVAVLFVFIGRAHDRILARGFTTRPATWGALVAAWGSGVLLGLTLPDTTPDGMQTILSGARQPWLDVAIGIANPAATIMIAFTIIALVLAVQDARGPRPVEDH